MSVSSASDVDLIALQLTINPGDRGGRQTLAMATLISPVEAVTAYHVLHSLGPESELTVRLRNTESYPVAVVATDPAADLALLRAPSPLPFSSRRVAERVPVTNEPWMSFLIPPMVPDGIALAGVVLGRDVVDGIEHLALSVSGASSPAGSSGAPVVVDGAVVGILARANPDGTNWYALPVTTASVERLRDPARQLERSGYIERFEPRDFFARLSPSSIAAFNHADGMRLGNGQDKLHMEHLVMGLYLKENGPAQALFTAASIGSERDLRKILNGATDLHLPGLYTPSELTALPPISRHVQEALEHAQRIARRTEPTRVRSRHLLSGALSVEDCDVIKALVRQGVSRDRIRLTDAGTDDTGIPIVGADSDAPSGIDRLGLETEIDTLSALVASRSTKTPMSIGLFGNWGSGKSFFMQKMDERIRVFRDSASDDPDSPYCKSIIQLKFNAWHYIDRSLWASLGAEIFEGLAHGLTEVETKKDGPQLEDQRTTLLVKRADAEAQRVKAQEVLAQSTADLSVHRREITRIESQTDREIERSLGSKAIVEEVLAVTSSQKEVKTALDSAARALGWAELNDRAEVAAGQLKEILALASGTGNLSSPPCAPAAAPVGGLPWPRWPASQSCLLRGSNQPPRSSRGPCDGAFLR